MSLLRNYILFDLFYVVWPIAQDKRLYLFQMSIRNKLRYKNTYIFSLTFMLLYNAEFE